MSCSGSHLEITINIKNTKFVKDLPMIDAQFRFNQCNSFINLSTADLGNDWTEFHETWWSYRYMFLIGPKVFSFVVKGVKGIF
jgi:hypothetical protein